jgi:hypothetical protein
MRLNPQCILSIVCLLLSSKINPCLSVFLIIFLIIIFYVFLDAFAFHFCMCPYHAHKLDFHSSPFVFLAYSSSHLSYRCLNLAFQRIYISCHIRFHEDVFFFNKPE